MNEKDYKKELKKGVDWVKGYKFALMSIEDWAKGYEHHNEIVELRDLLAFIKTLKL